MVFILFEMGDRWGVRSVRDSGEECEGGVKDMIFKSGVGDDGVVIFVVIGGGRRMNE